MRIRLLRTIGVAAWAGLAVVPCWAASVIGTTTTQDALRSASKYYTQGASGHYWVAYDDGAAGPILYSSRDAVTWTSQGAIFSFNPNSSANHWAVRYLGNAVIALAFRSSTNTRYYRDGTLNTDGTVAWSIESPAGPADATQAGLNALIANGKPIMWRADVTSNGAIWRGSALSGPAWSPAAGAVPGMGLTSPTAGFGAGAIFPTGGGDPDDLIVLRAATENVYTAGSHRLLALKWDASLGAYDGSWYNVSTLNGGLPEDATSEVRVLNDLNIQRQFAAVRDSSGNLHALYTNRNLRIVHYKKDIGFNNSWSRLSTDVAGVNIAKVSVSAAAGNNLFLFYEKTAPQEIIYVRRFDGTTWGPESLVYDGTGLNLHRALAPMESANGCSIGVAFTNGTVSPYNVRFSLGVGDCAELRTVRTFPGNESVVTVTAPGSFEMVFSTAVGGGIEQFYDLAESPLRDAVHDLAGGTTGQMALFGDELAVGGTNYKTDQNVQDGRLDVLEATPTRVRMRHWSFYQSVGPGSTVGGVKGIGEYSIYPSGRYALGWKRQTTSDVSYTAQQRELNVHYQGAGALNAWAPYSDAGALAPSGPAGSDFTLAQNDSVGARTDFLNILYQDWPAATSTNWSTSAAREWAETAWTSITPGTQVANTTQTWNLLTYFKPTDLGDTASPWLDPDVTSRSADYRNPDDLASPLPPSPGGGWFDPSENTASPSDFYNEAEAAYTLDFDPAAGLTFDIDGNTFPRYKPFFKIRQWRSLEDPLSVKLEGVTLTNDVDFKADLKPISRAPFYRSQLFHSTLQDPAAVSSPDIGSAASVTAGVSFEPARYGSGARVPSDLDSIAIPTAGNFDKTRGLLSFWMRPTYDSGDGMPHDIAGFYVDASNGWFLEKAANNSLYFRIIAGGATTQIEVLPANYSWRAQEWVGLKMEWNENAASGKQLTLSMFERDLPDIDSGVDYVAANLTLGPNFLIGNNNNGGPAFSSALYDEIEIARLVQYNSASGAVGDSIEYLADPSPGKNRLLDFTAVDANGRGRYLILGTDSKFRGLNVALATVAVGVSNPGALVWEYWNGTAWASLELPGFTDQTNDLTRNGTIYWTADPPGWAPSPSFAGVDLYRVRVHLPVGASYGTFAVERLIKTDILLFQYCGDITTAAQTFEFGLPVATAVKLQSLSATAVDAAVDLVWQTASELDNLGFHLYRGPSESGPWTRITPSLIPGLGSSPTGASYSWHDTGLSNGTRYFYRLEDVDTTSVSTFHGPVSAVPQAGATPTGGDEGDGTGSGAGVGTGGAGPGETGSGDTGAGGAGSAVSGSGGSDPSLVPACSFAESEASSEASTSPLGPFPCVQTVGDPTSASVRVVSRTPSQAVVELQTGGFYAIHDGSGRVRLSVPGFEDPADPHAPALPFKRAVLAAEVGRVARLGTVETKDVQTWTGLVPSAVGYREMDVRSDGTVRAGWREAELRSLGPGPVPRELVRVGGESFQGEAKTVSLEMSPLRFDRAAEAITLARRVRVRVDFVGREAQETGRGTRGRRVPRLRRGGGDTLAYLRTTQTGLHSVSFEALFPGRSRRHSLNALRLDRQGEAVPYHVEPGGGAFGPGGVLFFYADEEADSTSFSAEVTYELVRAPGGVQMSEVNASPFGNLLTSASLGPVSRETNQIYQSGLLEAPDLWVWEPVVGGPGGTKTKGFVLEGVDGTSSEAGRVSVWLQGGSDAMGAMDHHVRISMGAPGNAVLVGEATFDGKRPYRLDASVPTSVLQEGQNELLVENVGDTGVYSLVFLDRFRVEYPQRSELRSGVFEGVWPRGGVAEIGGVGSAPAFLAAEGGRPASDAQAASAVVIPSTMGRAGVRGVRPTTVDPSGPGGSEVQSQRGRRAARSLVGSLSSVAAVDVTDPRRPLWLVGLEPGASSVRLRAETGRRYVLASPEGLLTPRVSVPVRSSLKNGTNQADYILIAPQAFLPAAQPLLDRRESQALRTKAVSLEEIASVFGHGEASGEAIRSFLTHAYHSWQQPSVRYVVLLGDASTDPRNFKGTSGPAPLPALFLKTAYLVTASDPALGAVNGDDLLPDLAIGRLPAQTVEEAEALVSKLLAWEDSGQGLSGKAVLVADNPDEAGDFEADVADIRDSFLGGHEGQTILLSQEGAGTRAKILDAFNDGSSFMSYVGHGGSAVWASENVWNSWDVASLQAQSTQPLLLTMNCLNGYFVAPSFDSLSESLLKAEGRGAVAAFSPSGLSVDGPAHQYHRVLMAELTSGTHERLGDAILAAQQAYAQTGLMPELLSVYHLFADPAMRIR